MSNTNLSDIIENIIVHVYMSEDEPPCDIINFYNKVFLQAEKTEKLKDFITNVRNAANNGNANGMQNANKANKKNTLLMSPMKAIIPKDSFKAKTTLMNNGNTKGRNNNLTPQTQLLFAYNESPILKYEVNTFKAPLKSKKVLHYED